MTPETTNAYADIETNALTDLVKVTDELLDSLLAGMKLVEANRVGFALAGMEAELAAR